MGKGRKYPKNNKLRHKANKILGDVATENSEPLLKKPEDQNSNIYKDLCSKPVHVEKRGFNKGSEIFKYIGAVIATLAPVFAFVFWVATLQSRVGENEKDISQLSKDRDSSKKVINDLKVSTVVAQKDIGYLQKQLDFNKVKDSENANK